MLHELVSTPDYDAACTAADVKCEGDLLALIATRAAALPVRQAAKLEEDQKAANAKAEKAAKSAAKARKRAETQVKNKAAAVEAKAAGPPRPARSSRSATVVDDRRQRAPSLTFTDTSSITERSEAQTPAPEVQQPKKRKGTAATQSKAKKQKTQK